MYLLTRTRLGFCGVSRCQMKMYKTRNRMRRLTTFNMKKCDLIFIPVRFFNFLPGSSTLQHNTINSKEDNLLQNSYHTYKTRYTRHGQHNKSLPSTAKERCFTDASKFVMRGDWKQWCRKIVKELSLPSKVPRRQLSNPFITRCVMA